MRKEKGNSRKGGKPAVVVAFVVVRLVMNAVAALRRVAKRLVLVL